MNLPRFTHVLTFLLPAGSRRVDAPAGGWPPQFMVELGRAGLVTIMGPSRDAIFDVAASVARQACAGLPEQSIAIRVYARPIERESATRDWLHVSTESLGAVDGWSMIVGAEVAFSPTALDSYFPKLEPMARPAPKAIER